MPSSRKLPRLLLSLANSRSPCSTWMSTLVWPSAAVEKVSLLVDGTVVLRAISLLVTPPRVSTPRLRGVTSSRTTEATSPERTPACTAAPRATTSSGLTVMFGSLPVSSLTSCCTLGMRVEPPTRTTSSMSLGASLASASAWRSGPAHRANRSSHSASNLARDSDVSMCFGPSWLAVMNGRLRETDGILLSSSFALIAASVRRCMALRSPERSMPSAFLKSPISQSTILRSKSSPPEGISAHAGMRSVSGGKNPGGRDSNVPRWVSPLVESTSKTPSPTSRRLTSKVPPPKSKTRIVSFPFLSRP